VPIKWLGDGVMIHHREPAGAVLSALELVAQLPAAGLPPAHVGVAAGRVVAQGGDYFGRTVNLAARIAAHAGAGQVLVSASVAESAPPQSVRFVEQGSYHSRGSPIRCGCWRPAGRERLTPRPRLARPRRLLGRQGAAVAQRKRSGGSSPKTRKELYEIAKRRDLPGRSKMGRDELARALGYK
jgi:hypothetical protein